MDVLELKEGILVKKYSNERSIGFGNARIISFGRKDKKVFYLFKS
jgi:hypothetical protein